MGYLLSQQLVAAGETVLDVPATLASRVRVLGTGQSTKTDPNDARSVAVAALTGSVVGAGAVALTMSRCVGCWPSVTPMWPAGGPSCAVDCMLWWSSWCPAGSARKWSSTRHDHCSGHRPDDAAAAERHRQALELVDEIEHLDIVRQDSRARITAAVTVSATTLTEIFGVGPIVAAMLIGYSGDPLRFTTANRYAAYTGTAPIEFSSGGRTVHRLSRRGNRRLNHALHCAAITQIRHRHSPGRGYYERKLAEGHTPREAIRALKRRLSDIVWRHLVADARRRLVG